MSFAAFLEIQVSIRIFNVVLRHVHGICVLHAYNKTPNKLQLNALSGQTGPPNVAVDIFVEIPPIPNIYQSVPPLYLLNWMIIDENGTLHLLQRCQFNLKSNFPEPVRTRTTVAISPRFRQINRKFVILLNYFNFFFKKGTKSGAMRPTLAVPRRLSRCRVPRLRGRVARLPLEPPTRCHGNKWLQPDGRPHDYID